MRIEPLGHAIERVSAILEEGRAPPGGLSRHAEWLARAAKNDIADVGLLADSVSDQKPAEAEANLEAMAEWPEDARIARAMLVDLVAFRYADRPRAWKALGSLILRNADDRFRPEFELLRDGPVPYTQVMKKLVDAINADRESDAPFLVYADWRSERGHPRGERIVLPVRESGSSSACCGR